jgi:hypothetical protein
MLSMQLPYRLYFLSILVSISACGFHRTQSANNVSSKATPTPQVLTETAPQKPVQSSPIEREWKNRFTFKAHSVSEKHDGYCPYELSAEYPEAASKNIAVKRFNRWIKRKVLGDVARFRRLELRAEPRARREGKRLITEGLELTFDMYYSNDKIISLRLTHSVMAAGQMHPIDYYETINYDLVKGRPLRAQDVFRRGYLKALSDYSRKWLRETYEIPNETWFMEGTAPRVRNFPNWNIVPDGILVSFEDYQVSSHNFGQPELIVPYSTLKRFLRRRELIEHSHTRKPKTFVGQTKEIKNREIRIREETMAVTKITYRGYSVRKRHRKVKFDDAVEGGHPYFANDEYATLVRDGRTLLRFDGVYAPMGNVMTFGLFSFLARGRKQLFVSQDTFRGGNQWVVNLRHSPHVIYDGREWATGRELDDMSVVDLDGDDVFEISVPTCIFYGFAALSPAGTPLPTIIFKYSTKAGRYLPANPRFADHLLARIEDQKQNVRPIGDQLNNMNHLSDVLSIVLDCIFAGREKEAWTFYEGAYKLPDKSKIQREIRAVLRDSPVYRFIYHKHSRHRRS